MNLIIIRFGKIVKPFFEKITHFEKIFRLPRTDCFKRPFQTDNIKIVEIVDGFGIICGKADAAAL